MSPVSEERRAAGELLRQVLREKGISKAEFARLIEREPHNVYRWCAGKEFSRENREQAALGLGLARDYFDQPSEQDRRELEAQRVLAQFLRRPYAKRLNPAQLGVIKSVRWLDEEERPSLALYETFAAVLLGDIPLRGAMRVAEANDAIDRTVDLTTRPRRRKTPPK
jgi:hypothetical protein